MCYFKCTLVPEDLWEAKETKGKNGETLGLWPHQGVSPGGSKAYMLRKVPNIHRIINNDILKIVNTVFLKEGQLPPAALPSAVYGPG